MQAPFAIQHICRIKIICMEFYTENETWFMVKPISVFNWYKTEKADKNDIFLPTTKEVHLKEEHRKERVFM